MFQIKKYILGATLCIASVSLAVAQDVGNSPYSLFGVGELVPYGTARNNGMGGVGVSNANPLFVNLTNPALLSRTGFTTFEAGASMQFSALASQEATQRDWGGNLDYITLMFPVGQRTGAAVAVRPYSYVSYDIASSQTVINDTTDVFYTYAGKGGLTQALVSGGVRLGAGFSLGLEMSYIFGSTERTAFSELNTDDLGQLKNGINRRVVQNGFGFRAGLNYRKMLGKETENKKSTFINVGLAYDFRPKLNAKRSFFIEKRNASDAVVSRDTVFNELEDRVNLPSAVRFGISFDKPGKWSVGADFTYYDWSEFEEIFSLTNLNNAFTVAVGGEITPDAGSVSSYWNRVTYRTGFSYSKTPLTVNGTQINDGNINIGFSFPVGRTYYNMLNLNLAVGRKGTIENDQIRSSYFKLGFGITINDRWFIKRKLN